MVKKLGLKEFGSKFWSSSSFDYNNCEDEVFSYCDQEYSEYVDVCLLFNSKVSYHICFFRVLTCSKMNWKRYLDIYETAMEVALANQDYAWNVFSDLRYSIIDEAAKGLATIFAVENFPHVDKTPLEANERKMRNLLLVALRVLPKLPFYLAADMWRLTELQELSENQGETWENTRREFQVIQGIDQEEFDFLDDLRIASNRPYLHKFLGTFLQFQLIDFYASYGIPEDGTVFDIIAEDSTFS